MFLERSGGSLDLNPQPFLSWGNISTKILLSFPSALTPTKFRTAGSQKKNGFDQLTEESNPGQLGEKRECYLCAMPSPHLYLDLPLHNDRIVAT